ncbi:MAG: hypothetical protein M0C28_00835 [Candidatus Moduliflexus flocculans]|nr:hypothetical protein [Candidatus Moduliflexus flocculans]
MDAQTNLLIISDDFSLYETIKKAPVAADFNVFFAQTDDDYLGRRPGERHPRRARRLRRRASPPGSSS